MPDLQQIILRRIHAVNLGRIKSAELLYCEERQGGGLAVALEAQCNKFRHVTQLRIPKPMMKALIAGTKNHSLDNILKL